MTPDVFISYSSRDHKVAEAVCRGLEEGGVSCWIAPRNITAGADWGAAIIDGINQSRAMILIFSSHSDASKQVLREVERAVAKSLPVIPVRIANITPSRSMEYFLSSTHWFDALTPPMESHLPKLLVTVRAHLAQGEHNQELIRLMRDADGGQAEAQCLLAMRLLHGDGIPADPTLAESWLSAASRQNHAEAHYQLARLKEGAGDLAEAFRLYTRAVSREHQAARERLSTWARDHGIAEEKPAPAAEPPPPPPEPPPPPKTGRLPLGWLAIAVGVAGLLLVLGRNPMPVQPPAATPEVAASTATEEIKLLIPRVQEGDKAALEQLRELSATSPLAQTSLGNLYLAGLGVERDPGEAAKWYRLAAEQGNANGQYLLGFLFENGQGVEKNSEEAARWYGLAAAQGIAEAKKGLARLGK